MKPLNGRELIRLNQVQFFQAADYLKKNKQVFLDLRPTAVEAAKTIGNALKFPVPVSAVSTLKEASGVFWVSKKGNSNTPKTANRTRILVSAIVRLYRKLGEEVPEALELLRIELSRGTDAAAQEQKP